MSFSEDNDLQSYLSAHKKDSHRGKEIDWTKLMDSVDIDNLNSDKLLYTAFDSDSDESNFDLFLKSPAKPATQHQSQARKEERRRLSAKRTSLGADPNVHAVSELNLSESCDVTLTSTVSDSTPIETAVVNVPQPGTYPEGDVGVSEGSGSLKPTGRVRNISDLSISEPTLSGWGEARKRGGADLKDALSLSDGEESSIQLSEVLAEKIEPLNIRQNVFSIEQLEELGETVERGQPLYQHELSEELSLSESLGGGYVVNIHTVDELLADSQEDHHRQADQTAHRVDNKAKNLKSSTNQEQETDSSQTGTPEEAGNAGNNQRTKKGFKFGASPLSIGEELFEHKVSVDEGDYSYSVDEDFESLTVTENFTEDSQSLGVITSRTVESTALSDGGEEGGGSPHEGVEEGENQYSGFSDEGETALNNTVSSNSLTPVDPHCSKDKQHSSANKHSNERGPRHSWNAQQDASVQTPSYLYRDSAPHPTPSLPDSGGPSPPTPILPHVLSAEQLQALAACSPQSVALNDLIKSQLALIRHSIETTRRQVTAISESVNTDHHYTTLEETKSYIERNKPKILTIKEAKKRYKKGNNF